VKGFEMGEETFDDDDGSGLELHRVPLATAGDSVVGNMGGRGSVPKVFNHVENGVPVHGGGVIVKFLLNIVTIEVVQMYDSGCQGEHSLDVEGEALCGCGFVEAGWARYANDSWVVARHGCELIYCFIVFPFCMI